MSHVTDVIITMRLFEETDEGLSCPAVDVLNDWLAKKKKGKLKRVDEFAGGLKCMQAAIFMGAFNHLDIPEFIKAVDAAPWEYRKGVTLFIKDEHEERFTDKTPLAPAGAV